MTNVDYLNDRRYVGADRYPAPEALSCARVIENSAVPRVSATNFVDALCFFALPSRDAVSADHFRSYGSK
jgi:hypothetical protein